MEAISMKNTVITPQHCLKYLRFSRDFCNPWVDTEQFCFQVHTPAITAERVLNC